MSVEVPAAAATDEARLAGESGRRLAERLRSGQELRPELRLGATGEAIMLPAAAIAVLADYLCRMGEGGQPASTDLSTEEAGDLLRVPPAYVGRLLAEGRLASRVEGGVVRVPLHALLALKRQLDADRVAAMEEMAAQAQDLGMGY